jgi:hypothetical protein
MVRNVVFEWKMVTDKWNDVKAKFVSDQTYIITLSLRKTPQR